MKNLYLHIGCGKTGSSALQVWLHKNADDFLKEGIFYPRFDEIKNDYQITSGNGVRPSVDILEKESFGTVLSAFANGAKNVLFSSENFQKLGRRELKFVREKCTENGIKIHVLAFVRDVYDMIFSTYMQMVKRSNCSKSFYDYAKGLKKIQQFEVVKLWGEFFPDIKLVHYDSHKKNLCRPFMEWLGLQDAKISEMSKNKVNRSLDLDEAEFLRLINKVYTNKFNDLSLSFSARISDSIILNNPEKKSKILLDERILNELNDNFRPVVDDFNKRFFGGVDCISIFNPDGKLFDTNVPVFPEFVEATVQALVFLTSSIETKGVHDVVMKQFSENINFSSGTSTESDGQLKIEDARVANLLRDHAIKLEQTEFSAAYILMLAAGVLRPNGDFIKKKISSYRDKAKKVNQ